MAIMQRKQLEGLRLQIEALKAQGIEKPIKYIANVPTLVDIDPDAPKPLSQKLPETSNVRTLRSAKNDSQITQQH